MRKISANWVFTVSSAPIPNGSIVVDERGEILFVGENVPDQYKSLPEEFFHGSIIPGFINTHCHLELSHMKGVAPTGTGLLPFIKTVVSQREVNHDFIIEKIKEADREMVENGIVAVGDISNKADTVLVKKESPIQYYTFIEMFDFLDENKTDKLFEGYLKVWELHEDGEKNKKSAVPHAPYSVNPKMYNKINGLNSGSKKTISLHNQETLHELLLFQGKKGGFIDFYKGFGVNLDHFNPETENSLIYALSKMDSSHRTLLVHNTLTDQSSIQFAHSWGREIFWATCPNANLYIENRLPDYSIFKEEGAKMTIGTDSLTSNWQLSILEEMKTILRYKSYLKFEEVLQWGTLNGAKALGFDEKLGSREKGKKPGLNLLDMVNPNDFGQQTQVKKIV